ncbi:MAG: hypothetical protein IJF02_01855 [Oscillospiraceae bacterium]|nr:hypothetical protein [Oscillospiraceae bacterium]
MKGFLRVWAVILCICAVLVLVGCEQPPVDTTVTVPTTAAPTEPPLSPREKYDLALDNLGQEANWILDYTLEEQRGVGTDTYTKKVVGKASFSKLYQKDMVAVIEEQLTYGSYTSDYTEVYCESMAFSKIKESYFKSEMEPEAFVQRQIPAVLIDSALYKTIAETVGETSTVIYFGSATAVENWAGNADAKIVSASGSAILDSSGALKETTCQITYSVGAVQYTVRAAVRITTPPALDLSGTHQEHIKGSTRIKDLDVPKMLLQMVGDVYAAGKMQCDAVESIYSEAVPLAYSQNSLINLTGHGGELTARAEYRIQLSDYRGDVSSSTQMDSFENGVFTSTVNGGKPQTNPAVTAQQMRSYCEDAILSALAAPKYLKDASLKVSKDSYRIEIDGNYDFVMDMMENITQFLQVDLDAKATLKKTASAGGYLVIDRETGLPTAMGLHVERQHTIDTVTYKLNYRLDQTMKLSDYE